MSDPSPNEKFRNPFRHDPDETAIFLPIDGIDPELLKKMGTIAAEQNPPMTLTEWATEVLEEHVESVCESDAS